MSIGVNFGGGVGIGVNIGWGEEFSFGGYVETGSHIGPWQSGAETGFTLGAKSGWTNYHSLRVGYDTGLGNIGANVNVGYSNGIGYGGAGVGYSAQGVSGGWSYNVNSLGQHSTGWNTDFYYSRTHTLGEPSYEQNNMVMLADASGLAFIVTPSRPDDDGYLTLAEAIQWYKEGNGVLLKVDLSKLDLTRIKRSDFIKGKILYANLASPKYYRNFNDAAVYGTIGLTYIGNYQVSSSSDMYDFDKQDWRKRPLREFCTFLGRTYNGQGVPYKIEFYNYGRIGGY